MMPRYGYMYRIRHDTDTRIRHFLKHADTWTRLIYYNTNKYIGIATVLSKKTTSNKKPSDLKYITNLNILMQQE